MNCSICNREENLRAGIQVKECDRCNKPVCGMCAEVDYDCVGNPPQYVNTQWICDSLKGGCRRSKPEFPEQHPQLKNLSEVQSERDAR